VACRLYRIAVIWPGSRAAITLSPSLGTDLLGCINCTREKERKGKEDLYIPAAYVLVRNHTSRNRLVQLNGDRSADPAYGKTLPPLRTVENPCRCYLYRARILRREEEKRRETRKHAKVIPSSISQLPNPCSNDHHARSLYLGVGLCWNCQNGRASAHDLASMGASTAGIGRSPQSSTSNGSYSSISNM